MKKHCELGQRKCKECRREYDKEYYAKNQEKKLIRQKKYHANNREKIIKKLREYYKNNQNKLLKQKAEYRAKNRTLLIKKNNAYQAKRRESDPLFNFICYLRARNYKILKNKNSKNNNKMQSFIGCSPADLITHMEKQFKPGMTWDNYGIWQADHIIPISSGKTELEVMQLNHYTNLQPLWGVDNIKKGAKVSK
jgi:hypothetical protein